MNNNILIPVVAFLDDEQYKLDSNELYLYSLLYRYKIIYDNITLINIDTISQLMKNKFYVMKPNGDDTRNKNRIKNILINLKEKNYINFNNDKIKYTTVLIIKFNYENRACYDIPYNVFDKIEFPKELLNYIIQKYNLLHLKKRKIRNYESGYEKWKTTVLENDNYTCKICNITNQFDDSIILHAHHKDGYDWCIERRTDPTNGVTLCDGCHTEFHILYGYGGNTEQQYIEFYENKKKNSRLNA